MQRTCHAELAARAANGCSKSNAARFRLAVDQSAFPALRPPAERVIRRSLIHGIDAQRIMRGSMPVTIPRDLIAHIRERAAVEEQVFLIASKNELQRMSVGMTCCVAAKCFRAEDDLTPCISARNQARIAKNSADTRARLWRTERR